MITVIVYINGTPIITRSARRREPFKGRDDTYSYTVDDGRVVKHKYSDGAAELSRKLLKGVKKI